MPRPPRRAVVSIAVGAVVTVLGLIVLIPYLVRVVSVITSPADERRLLFVGVGVPGLLAFLASELGTGGLLITLGLVGVGLGAGRIRGSRRAGVRYLRPALVVAGVLMLLGTGLAVSGRAVGTALMSSDIESLLFGYSTAFRMQSVGMALVAVGVVTLAVVVGWARGARAANRGS